MLITLEKKISLKMLRKGMKKNGSYLSQRAKLQKIILHFFGSNLSQRTKINNILIIFQN